MGDAHTVPFDDASFDLVCAIEMLEQVTDPERVLRELARVSRGDVLVSVPREPIWRALNIARGAYLRSLGNSPGNRHHFSTRAFVRLCRTVGDATVVRTPFPWTMVLLRPAGRRSA